MILNLQLAIYPNADKVDGYRLCLSLRLSHNSRSQSPSTLSVSPCITQFQQQSTVTVTTSRYPPTSTVSPAAHMTAITRQPKSTAIDFDRLFSRHMTVKVCMERLKL